MCDHNGVVNRDRRGVSGGFNSPAFVDCEDPAFEGFRGFYKEPSVVVERFNITPYLPQKERPHGKQAAKSRIKWKIRPIKKVSLLKEEKSRPRSKPSRKPKLREAPKTLTKSVKPPLTESVKPISDEAAEPKVDVSAEKTLNKPQATLDQPLPTLKQPQIILNRPQPTLNVSQATLNESQPTLDQPQPTLLQPQPTLHQPKPTPNRLQPTLNRPQPTLSQPKPTLNRPQPTLNQAKPTLNWFQITLNQPQLILTRPQHILNQPKLILNKPQLTLNRPQPTFSEPPKETLHESKHSDVKLKECSVNLFRDDLEVLKELLKNNPEELQNKQARIPSMSLRCNICEKLYSSLKKLQNHQENKHMIVYKPENGKTHKRVSFSDKVIVHELKEYHKCRKCPRIFENYRALKVHTKELHKKRKCYVCHFCMKNFVDRMFFKVHIKLHCDYCGLLFTSKTKCANHKRNICKAPKFQKCKECNLNFFRLTDLEDHSYDHSGVKCFVCDICKEKCPSKCAVAHHIYFLHSDRQYGPNPTLFETTKIARESLFHCRFCEESSVDQNLLERHVNLLPDLTNRAMTDYKDYYFCDQCLKHFDTEADMLQHKWSHFLKTPDNSQMRQNSVVVKKNGLNASYNISEKIPDTFQPKVVLEKLKVDEQPLVEPSTQLVDQPPIEPMDQSPTQPEDQPVTQHQSRPLTISPSQHITLPPSQPVIQPLFHPITFPPFQPMTHPATQPITQLMTQTLSQPITLPPSPPTIQPYFQPVTLPPCQPILQPPSQPITQYAVQPMTQPFSQPSQSPSQPITQSPAQPSQSPSQPSSSQASSHLLINLLSQPSSPPLFRPMEYVNVNSVNDTIDSVDSINPVNEVCNTSENINSPVNNTNINVVSPVMQTGKKTAIVDPRPKKTIVSKHQCDNCGKYYSTRFCLHRHIETQHSDYENLRCGVCEEVFVWPSLLKSHKCIRLHVPEMPFEDARPEIHFDNLHELSLQSLANGEAELNTSFDDLYNHISESDNYMNTIDFDIPAPIVELTEQQNSFVPVIPTLAMANGQMNTNFNKVNALQTLGYKIVMQEVPIEF